MKLLISKNDNGYYTKITNEYNNEKTELFLTIQLSKNVSALEYGLYEVDGFMSCYKGKDGNVKPKLIITSATLVPKKNDKITHDDLQDDDPFTQMSEQVEIDDQFLD